MMRRIHPTGLGVRLPSLLLLLVALVLVGTACTDSTEPASTVPGGETLPFETLPPETLPPETTLPTDPTTDPTTAATSATDADATILETIGADGRFSTLLQLIEDAELTDNLADSGLVTLFAPTDEAFDSLPAETLAALSDDSEALLSMLLSHMVGYNLSAEDVALSTALDMASGAQQVITLDTDGVVTIGGATVIESDIEASNGTIHVVDSVLPDTSGT
ncbi:MAG: fasciclin domain-containing protein [Actinomycetota bacterium]|nr:fasciclin domain-containing protein [Actinomycetota bacterium]